MYSRPGGGRASGARVWCSRLVLAPGVGTSFALAGMTSARGRSHMFDARADGYARGEACGAVIELLRRAPFSTHTILVACASAYLQMTLLLFITVRCHVIPV